MKSAGLIGIGILVLWLCGCGGSDEEVVEAAKETTSPEQIQEQPTSKALSPGNKAGEVRSKPKALSEPTLPSDQQRLETETKLTGRTRQAKAVAANRDSSSTETRQPVTPQTAKNTPIHPSVSGETPEVEQTPSPPRPAERIQVAEERSSGNQEVREEHPAAHTIVIPPSPPRRSTTGMSGGPGPVVVADNVEQANFKFATLPAGSVIEIRTAERVSSGSNVSGDFFEATLTEDLIVDGEVAFARGSEVTGRLLEVLKPGKVKGRGSVTFNLQEIKREETVYTLETSSITMEAESSKGKDAAKIGAATAIGAVLGAVFGGKKGAAIGGATAGGAGTAGVLLSRGKDVEIPAERLFSFRLDKDVEIRIR